jgi:septal ring-binding cell division protein DamX
MEPVKNSGSFSDISCPRLLAHLHQTRFDGTIRISSGVLLKLLYFQGGEIAMASSNDQEDHLAPILIRAGKLKPEQMDLARKSMQGGTSLARVLVQMGFLTSGELFAGARQQLRQIVRSVLGMTDASYEIQPGYFPREITSLNVDTREMILELIRDLSDRSFVLLEVGAPDTVYAPLKATNHGNEPVRLPRAWKEYAERFSTPMAIREFGQGANLDDFTASKVVYGLSLLGCVAQEPPSEAVALSVPVIDAASQEESPAGTPPAISTQPAEHAETRAPLPKEEPAGEPVPAATARRDEEPVEPIQSFRERFHPPTPAPSSERLPPPTTAPRDLPSRPQAADAGSQARGRERGSGEEPSSQSATGTLEFKSPYGSRPPAKPSRPWATASVIGGICLLALTSVWFIFLRVPESDSTSPSAPVPGAAAAQTRGEAAGKNAAPGNPSSASEKASEEPAARQSDQSSPPEPQAQGSETPAPPQEAQANSSPPSASPMTKPEASSPESPRAPGGEAAPAPGAASDASGFSAARAQLDAGSYAAAARGWAQIFRSKPAQAFTLQIAIACQEETLRKAARRTEGSDQFFVVPFTMQGKVCYRLCWGSFPTLDSAQSARSSVPSFFLEEGGHPIVVSLQKSIAPEGR